VSSSVSIRPGVRMLGLFQSLSYQEWYAIGELVDNSLQSWRSNRLRLAEAEQARGRGRFTLRVEVEVSRDSGEIVIRDNAAGIAAKDWGRAFRVAEPPEDATGLSQFGVGMKAAACWFAKRWSLRTTALGDPVQRSVTFDVPRIMKAGTEHLEVLERPVPAQDHYTELRLWDLHRTPRGRTVGKIKDHLASIYRDFLKADDVVITFNGERLVHTRPEELVAPRWDDRGGQPVLWHKDVELELDSGRLVRGWVALMKDGKRNKAGLALLYRGKVVVGAGDDAYKPPRLFGSGNSFEGLRMFGELDMSDFDVTFSKDNLVWYDEEDDVVEALKAELEDQALPLLRQAREYRTREAKVDIPSVDDVLTRTGDLLGDAGDLGARLDAAVERHMHEEETEASTPGAVVREDEPLSSRSFQMVVYQDVWSVNLTFVVGSPVEDWLVVRARPDLGAMTFEARVNQGHQFMRTFCEMPVRELEPVFRLAVAVGLAQEVARAQGVARSTQVTRAVNMLVDLLSEPAAR